MKIQENISLAPYTTFKIGGPAKYFCLAKSMRDLEEALAFARAQKLPLFILGGGSNIVIADTGFAGLVIKMEIAGASHEKRGDDVLVTAWAGEPWDELVAKTVEWGAWGIENLSGIPGTVGASPVQNIGAYGTEVMNTIESVTVIDAMTGKEKIFSNKDCKFSYRDSIFKKPESKNFVILSVTFKLSSKPQPNLVYKDLKEHFLDANNLHLKKMISQADIREAVLKIRARKFPDLSKIGTAGSFWKNPIVSVDFFKNLQSKYPEIPSFPADKGNVKIPLAWILDKVCGLKGYTEGSVALFENQPLLVVAKFGSTASQIKAFEAHISSIIKDKTGIEIEPEVGFLL